MNVSTGGLQLQTPLTVHVIIFIHQPIGMYFSDSPWTQHQQPPCGPSRTLQGQTGSNVWWSREHPCCVEAQHGSVCALCCSEEQRAAGAAAGWRQDESHHQLQWEGECVSDRGQQQVMLHLTCTSFGLHTETVMHMHTWWRLHYFLLFQQTKLSLDSLGFLFVLFFLTKCGHLQFQRVQRAAEKMLLSNQKLAKVSLSQKPTFRDAKLLLAVKYKELERLRNIIQAKQEQLGEFWNRLCISSGCLNSTAPLPPPTAHHFVLQQKNTACIMLSGVSWRRSVMQRRSVRQVFTSLLISVCNNNPL